MDLTKFRWWAGKAMADRETWATYIGTSNPYTGAAENLEKVTEASLCDQEYRRKYRIMLSSGIKDIYGVEIYEGDILEIFSDRNVRFTISRMAFVECSPEQVFVAHCANSISLREGIDCAVIGNFYKNPKLLESFDSGGILANRWNSNKPTPPCY